jgi:pyruvate dehydrogenase E2 component (dihydrolipoamide acetyltransferase)
MNRPTSGVAVAIDEGSSHRRSRCESKGSRRDLSRDQGPRREKRKRKSFSPKNTPGATFSISNLGNDGIKEFTAIINPPEAAIIAVGGANPTAVVRDGQIVVRNIMGVTMSCDHRVVDGATGAKFLQTFKQMLETPAMMLM